jgi:hypothetical protein
MTNQHLAATASCQLGGTRSDGVPMPAATAVHVGAQRAAADLASRAAACISDLFRSLSFVACRPATLTHAV